jgi:hypothetical protein
VDLPADSKMPPDPGHFMPLSEYGALLLPDRNCMSFFIHSKLS